MKDTIGLVLIVVGIALMWVAIHGYQEPDPGFKGIVEALYHGIQQSYPQNG